MTWFKDKENHYVGESSGLPSQTVHAISSSDVTTTEFILALSERGDVPYDQRHLSVVASYLLPRGRGLTEGSVGIKQPRLVPELFAAKDLLTSKGLPPRMKIPIEAIVNELWRRIALME